MAKAFHGAVPDATRMPSAVRFGGNSIESVHRRRADGAGSDFEALGGIGRAVLGPLLLGFSRWLLEQIEDGTEKKAYFLSRDGHLLMRAFALVARQSGSSITPVYLHVSRRSAQMANFEPADGAVDRLLNWLKITGREGTLGGYCRFLGIAPPDDEDLRRYGLPDAETDLGALREADADRRAASLRAYFASRVPELHRRAQDERAAYLTYLGGMGVFDEPTLNVVDCGWFGSTLIHMDALLRSAGADRNVQGYFVGFRPSGTLPANVSAKGHLFSDPSDLKSGRQAFEIARLVELFLKTDEAPFYCFEELPRGNLRRIEGPEPVAEQEIGVLQDAALGYLEDRLASAGTGQCDVRSRDVLNGLTRLLENPTRAEASALGRRHYSISPHSEEAGAHFALPRLTLWQMLTNRRRLAIDLRNSGSKQIYRALCDSPAKRLLVDLTSIDNTPPSRFRTGLRALRDRVTGRTRP